MWLMRGKVWGIGRMVPRLRYKYPEPVQSSEAGVGKSSSTFRILWTLSTGLANCRSTGSPFTSRYTVPSQEKSPTLNPQPSAHPSLTGTIVSYQMLPVNADNQAST